jgi:hypothetical protein
MVSTKRRRGEWHSSGTSKRVHAMQPYPYAALPEQHAKPLSTCLAVWLVATTSSHRFGNANTGLSCSYPW